ncbi:MAG: bifunctional oligoribonuclease/PAP phosphatase NrnA [Elusimicrobiota bacterium]|jgi:phosphoesterase RecJ-like protein|nr:bifunctional oligoribonuclease/PAP phosphatase NrnA [Elusimicrobiota bacterium]
MNELSKISKIIKQSKTFFIAGHIKPDGDSLGAAFALSKMLSRLGKKAQVYCLDEIPKELLCIKGIKSIKQQKPVGRIFDCAIILESLNLQRMGDIISPQQAKKIINIDHHKSYSNFGDVNYVDGNSSSVSELVLNLFNYLKLKPTKDEASNLYVGLLTDTRKFQNSNVSSKSHLAAAQLIDCGASASTITRQIYSNKTFQSLKLLAMALLGLKTFADGKVAYVIITQKMLKDCGAKSDDSNGIANYLLKVSNVQVACMIKEDGENTRLSMRSVKEFNLLPIAQKFGGGGHKNAAGATVKKTIPQVEKLLKTYFKSSTRNR